MNQKVAWIDNLRGIACLMVIVIHTTTWYLTNVDKVSLMTWDVANVLNSASRVCVPLFFMISGYLFFGERSAQPRHIVRLFLCLVFYSAIALLYMSTLTRINAWQAWLHILQKPVFYHLWFFYALFVLYLLSPLINARQISAPALLLLIAVLGVIANPNMLSVYGWHTRLLPVDLYIQGDVFYYILYGVLGYSLGQLQTERGWVTLLALAGFIACVVGIIKGTQHALHTHGNFADTWYRYASPLVLLAAISLFILVKNTLGSGPVPGLATIARYSLGIYGFHAFFIHFLRTRGIEITRYPLLDMLWIFSATLAGSLALATVTQWVDRKRWVS
ncbi:acetyltransferase [Mangrovibacter phragmitis]|jgi:surface polysaccharide O-acyltransferase-like enzyme|uniref:O-acetyltransferase WecH n=1 Tax=Mangrovibacter phragmitis TaxID=1691903 RepID=A0A1B7L4T0_9ENTR|nr:acyltransferase [Mangrovibacter phragmitis]OAT77286.1 acetyltransferase [Mangrovibacter phragmitis]